MSEASISNRSEATKEGVFETLPSDSIKGKSVRGGAVAVLGQAVSMTLQIGTTVILARLLSPTDYGLQSMVVTMTAFVSLFKDAGLNLATVQRESMTGQQLSTLFWINAGLGAFLAAIVAASAPFLAAFYKEPRLLWLTVASASVFLLNGLSAQHRALLDRAMRFSTSVKIDILSGIVGAAIAIVMAAHGFAYWSLICQTISLPIVGTIAVWMAIPWMPGRPHWTPELRAMVRFGGTITLNTFVVYIGYNTEKVLLGRYWGAEQLGIYGRAYQLATLPVQQLFSAVYVVAFSTLARMHGDSERVQRAYLKSQTIIGCLLIPIVVVSMLFAKDIVLVLLGPNWIEAADVLRLLAPMVLVLTLVNPFSWLLQSSVAWVERSLKMAFLIAPVVILGVLAGIRRGPEGVALGYSAAMVLLFIPIVAWAIHGTGITIRRYWTSVKPPLISGLVGGSAGWVAQSWMTGGWNLFVKLSVEVVVFAGVYLAILLFTMKQKDFFVDLIGHLQRRTEVRA